LEEILPYPIKSVSIKGWILRINTPENHAIPRSFGLTNDKVSPNSFGSLRIIRRKSRGTSESICLAKNSIYSIGSKNAVLTIHNTVKLSLFMKSKSELIMNFFLCRNVFPKGKFQLISISFRLWTRKYGVPMSLCKMTICRKARKTFSHLLIFDSQLLLIPNWEPFTSSIHLVVGRKRLLKRRMFDYIEHLSFQMPLPNF
jgi:hypothetical protein